uniref:C2H2-type domain-containing protein n=1 Tax=Leptobrachium leishanense TaxID=445787 RepID=A0A8C5M4J8_9ANUR
MNKGWNRLTQKILDLTLEILYLLTGEDLKLVMIKDVESSSDQSSEAQSRAQSPSVELPSQPLIHEPKHEKILELTKRMIHLLTGEVPIRCEDVTVYLSVEEWEYVERHKDLYKDVMMDKRQPLNSRDKSVYEKDHSSVPLPDSGNEDLIRNEEKYLKEETGRAESEGESLASVERNVLEQDIDPVAAHSETRYLHTDIKEEPASSEENVTDMEMSVKPDRQKNEADVFPVTMNTHQVPHYSGSNGNPGSTEMGKASNSDSDLMKHDTKAHCSGEAPYSSCHSVDFAHVSTSKRQKDHAEEEPFPSSECDEHVTQTPYLRIVIKEEPGSCDEGNDTDLYNPSDDTQTNYTPGKVKPSERLLESRKPNRGKYPEADAFPVMINTDLVPHYSGYRGISAPFSEIGEASYFGSGHMIHDTQAHCSVEDPCYSFDYTAGEHQNANAEENPFSCPECDERFTNSLALKKHQKIHTGNKPFKCSECGKCFRWPSLLEIHKRIHTGEKPFKCTECGRCFIRASNLKNHEQIHTGHKPFNCAECGKCFATNYKLSIHNRLHTGEKPYSCDDCGKRFSIVSNLITHRRSHAEKQVFKCPVCGKGFYRASHLKKHERIHTGEKPFKCNECGKCFTQASRLAAHKWIHTGEKPFKCSECGKSFAWLSHLTTHERVHTGERPFECNECGKCFMGAPNLQKHKLTHTGPKEFNCTECGKCFPTRYKLNIHNRVHSGEKPFSCDECGKCFSFLSSLTAHRRIHTEEKSFKCAECGEDFPDSAQLALHEQLHLDEKPFGCSECGKRFLVKYYLTEHLKIHTGEKPYKCSECGKCFTARGSLYYHMKIHSGEFQCTPCGKCFSSQLSLNRHLKSHAAETHLN